MTETINIIGAFVLGGLIPFGTIGGLIGYYWARASIRISVFEWLRDNWPREYEFVARHSTYSCATCLTPCDETMSYCSGCGKELEAYSTE